MNCHDIPNGRGISSRDLPCLQDQFGEYDENEVKKIDEKIRLSQEKLKQLQETLKTQDAGKQPAQKFQKNGSYIAFINLCLIIIIIIIIPKRGVLREQRNAAQETDAIRAERPIETKVNYFDSTTKKPT